MTPGFWYQPAGWRAALLAPLAGVWRLGRAAHSRLVRPQPTPIPVLCVGNVVAGGAGKTPVTLALAAAAQQEARPIHLLTRGYGGQHRQPHRVLPDDPAARVGDEALLLAALAPTWVARDRLAGITAAAQAGAELVIMDDGLQHPALCPTRSILVLDGESGLGNGCLMPAGPLREPLATALERTAAVVLLGADRHGLGARCAGRPVYRARRITYLPAPAHREPVVVFAGLARPQAFFRACARAGAAVVASVHFADHHPYDAADWRRLEALAKQHRAVLLTSAKDAKRLPANAQAVVQVAELRLVWDDDDAPQHLLAGL